MKFTRRTRAEALAVGRWEQWTEMKKNGTEWLCSLKHDGRVAHAIIFACPDCGKEYVAQRRENHLNWRLCDCGVGKGGL